MKKLNVQNVFHGSVGSVQQGDHNSASPSLTESLTQIEDEAPEVLYDEEVDLIADGGFEDYPVKIERDGGILFQVDADDAIDVFLLDPENYETWRNEQFFEFSYDEHRSKAFVKRLFRPEDAGEYILVIFNSSAKTCTVDVRMIGLETAD